MIPLIENHKQELDELCRKYGVTRLELFGSASDESFDPSRIDIDFLVEFHDISDLNAFHQFFGFKLALESLLGYFVDLVDSTSMRNESFIESVNKTRKLVYAAKDEKVS